MKEPPKPDEKLINNPRRNFHERMADGPMPRQYKIIWRNSKNEPLMMLMDERKRVLQVFKIFQDKGLNVEVYCGTKDYANCMEELP